MKKSNTKPKKGKGRKAPNIARAGAMSRSGAMVAIGAKIKSGAPSVNNLSGGAVRVKHRELVSNVLGSIAYDVQSFPLNPGIKAVFPWLSALAGGYESFVFHGLNFLYETIKSTSTDGVVAMATDYDAADPVPVDRVAIMAHQGAVRSAAWQTSKFVSRVKDLRKRKTNYVRTGPIDSKEDLKSYDVGNFNIATEGMANDSQVGELYVEYDVELQTPVVKNNYLSGEATKSFVLWSPGPRQSTIVNGYGCFRVSDGQDLTTPGFFGNISDDRTDLTQSLWEAGGDFKVTSDGLVYANDSSYDLWVSSITHGKYIQLRPNVLWCINISSTLEFPGASTFPVTVGFAGGTGEISLHTFPCVAQWPNTLPGGNIEIQVITNSRDTTIEIIPESAPLSCSSAIGEPLLDDQWTQVRIYPMDPDVSLTGTEMSIPDLASPAYKPKRAIDRRVKARRAGDMLRVTKEGKVELFRKPAVVKSESKDRPEATRPCTSPGGQPVMVARTR